MDKKKISLAISMALAMMLNHGAHADSNQPPAPPNGGSAPPPPPPNGDGKQQSQKVSLTEGDWSFDLITTGQEKTATVTYYTGKTDAIVAVPAVLGGAKVMAIAAQAFGHHAEILALYVPSSVSTVEDWALYDLNSAQVISFANPDVKIANGALQSSANATIYLPVNSSITQVGGNHIAKTNTTNLMINVTNAEASAISPGAYLNVVDQKYALSSAQLIKMALSASHQAYDVGSVENSVVFKGEAYQAHVQIVQIAKNLANQITANELNNTFQVYSEKTAQIQNTALQQNKNYADVAEFLKVKAGAYLNGSAVQLDPKVQAYDVETGQQIMVDTQTDLLPSTGAGKYKYVTWRDNNHDGKIDQLYYSPYSLSYNYNDVTIQSHHKNLNHLKARDTLNPQYLAFANAAIKADGQNALIQKSALTLHSDQDGHLIDAKANKNRSILWANDYGTIRVGHLNAYSNAIGDWGRMSWMLGLASPNTEIVMEWGMNALLYATNGGQIEVGDLNRETSQFYANNDGANGIVAAASGVKSDQTRTPATSSVMVKNAKFNLQGWNNHVADTVYGGYASLQKVTASTGLLGSYAVGQSSALANDFGNGVVDADQFHSVVYGNRSAGAYVIGGGIINAKNSSFDSKMDAGVVIASGGTYHIEQSTLQGQIAIRNRGGIVVDASSDFTDVALKTQRDLQHYVTGQQAKKAVEAWKNTTGQQVLASVLMSHQGYTLGELAEHYQLSREKTAALLRSLSVIAQQNYTAQTLLRQSVLDNTFYNYSAGQYMGDTDFSDIPYLTIGSSFGGLTASILEFENAGTTLNLKNITIQHSADVDYQYLLAAEAGSAPIVKITDSHVQGLVWNEGDVNRRVEGQAGPRHSSYQIEFNHSVFNGSFADGSSGLWSAKQSYLNYEGQSTHLNGNYYLAQANWKGEATFQKGSVWNIQHDSYLGKFILSADSQIIAPKGMKVKLWVNGREQQIRPGTYSGQVVLQLLK